jgi:hypothetical protein
VASLSFLLFWGFCCNSWHFLSAVWEVHPLVLNVLFGALVRSRFACPPVYRLFCFDHRVGILSLRLPPLCLSLLPHLSAQLGLGGPSTSVVVAWSFPCSNVLQLFAGDGRGLPLVPWTCRLHGQVACCCVAIH